MSTVKCALAKVKSSQDAAVVGYQVDHDKMVKETWKSVIKLADVAYGKLHGEPATPLPRNLLNTVRALTGAVINTHRGKGNTWEAKNGQRLIEPIEMVHSRRQWNVMRMRREQEGHHEEEEEEEEVDEDVDFDKLFSLFSSTR